MKCHFETTNSTTNPLSHGMATVSNTLSRCLADIKAYEALTLPENASQQLAYLKKLIWPLLADVKEIIFQSIFLFKNITRDNFDCYKGFQWGCRGYRKPHVGTSHCYSCPLCRCDISS